MSKLYPLKFQPILKDKIWGGHKLELLLNKEISPLPNAGESWEISGVPGNVSVVSNGFLAGNSLSEIIEIYMGDLVGDKIYQQFGNEFPLLIKFIDANDVLSIQVHPDDELAKQRHNSFGKTEMWYVMQADKGAQLVSGFSKELDKDEYLAKVEANEVESIMAAHDVAPGDVFFIPAGRVHAIGKGILLAEIQQTSDVTYRIYDFNRKDDQGNTRELHTEQAVDAIDYTYVPEPKTKYTVEPNKVNEVVKSDYFITNVLELDQTVKKDFYGLDSFLIYMCVEGSAEIIFNDNQKETIALGETVLVPADLKEISITPNGKARLIEVHL
ncbi:type I phosphomannose isomerase catalytic subunit [Carboxylicivirga caseinilyticus]|uniref:type I phosphomannose isomerase catalytic subunit n=1 Tax=Carboxylicivirga caseinilyticus TaxID=3417572 RepID=UPI003D332089|nr:class I mannose-6-phosphate isomerase [Marinilabiliaceae bacterium A049]